jgi:glucose-6-phosphate-specific signal transduction histidine kinase
MCAGNVVCGLVLSAALVVDVFARMKVWRVTLQLHVEGFRVILFIPNEVKLSLCLIEQRDIKACGSVIPASLLLYIGTRRRWKFGQSRFHAALFLGK